MGGGPGGAGPFEYAIDNTSQRAVRFLMSTAGRHRAWTGLRP